MSLFAKELKNVMRGILYIVFAGAIVFFNYTQFGSLSEMISEAQNEGYNVSNELTKPTPGQTEYGTFREEIPEIIMPAIMNSLISEWGAGEYITYPVGFYKMVRTNPNEQQKIADVIENLTGKQPGEIQNQLDILKKNTEQEQIQFKYAAPEGDSLDILAVTTDYTAFKSQMQIVDDILGGGSSYDPEWFIRFGHMPKTYEQALEEYNSIVYEDKISGAFARLFCDYSGISIALFSIFIPVSFMLRDRKSNMQQLIYPRRFSSARLVITRYFACLTAVLLPVIILGIIPAVQLGLYAAGQGLPYSPLAFLLYTAGWIGPTAMVTCSVGFFFTVLTGSPIGIAVQFFWSFSDFSSVPGLLYGGNFGTRLVPRHNMIGGLHLIQWQSLVINRIGYVVFSLVLLALTVLAYELQRKGRLDIYGQVSKIFRRGKNTVPANAGA